MFRNFQKLGLNTLSGFSSNYLGHIDQVLLRGFSALVPTDVWGWTILCWVGESVLCIVRCLAAFLLSTDQLPVAAFLPAVTTKNVSKHCHMSPGGQNQPWLRTTVPVRLDGGPSEPLSIWFPVWNASNNLYSLKSCSLFLVQLKHCIYHEFFCICPCQRSLSPKLLSTRSCLDRIHLPTLSSLPECKPLESRVCVPLIPPKG